MLGYYSTFFLLNGRKGSFSVYRIFVDSDNEDDDDETKFVDDDDNADEGGPSNQQAVNNDDDAEHEWDKFMAGMEVRQSNLTTATLLEINFKGARLSEKKVPVGLLKSNKV